MTKSKSYTFFVPGYTLKQRAKGPGFAACKAGGGLMKRNLSILLAISLSFVTLLLFQNCNKVQMSDVAGVSGKGTVLGTGQQTQPEGSSDDDEDDEFIAECNRKLTNMKEAIVMADDASFSDMNGNFFLKGNHLGSISRVYGNLHVLGTSADSSIASISASYGNMIICGMDVNLVKNFSSGNLVIVQGNVGDIDGFHGNLKLIGGRITGSIKNATGNLGH